MPIDGLVILKGGIALAKAVKDWLPKQEDRDRRLQDDLCFALRQLYFTPKGVISLLKDVAENREVSATRLRQVLGDFNDREWKVREALHRIDFYELKKELGISLATARVLNELQYGKAGLREEIQLEVNRYGQEGATPNKTKVKKLIASIERLNADIEDVEEAITARVRRRMPRKKPTLRKAAPKEKASRKK
jgi:flagellar biosynthesis regulator FlbT